MPEEIIMLDTGTGAEEDDIEQDNNLENSNDHTEKNSSASTSDEDEPRSLSELSSNFQKCFQANNQNNKTRKSKSLKDLISDNNPMVVANAVAAFAEIQDNSSRPIFEITSHTLSKLLTALNECTEWGQAFILDALSRYKAADAREAENIEERVMPRLQHANCAVVLSAVKMIL